MACAGDHHQPLLGGASAIVPVGHLNGYKAILGAVDEENRQLRLFHRREGRIAVGGSVDLFTENFLRHPAPQPGIVHVQVLFAHVHHDVPGGCEAAIGNHAPDALRHLHARRHEHRGGAHGNACQIDGQAEILPVRPLSPLAAVAALQKAEAQVIPLAVPVGSLLHQQHVAVVLQPEGRYGSEVPGPGGAPAMEGNDQPPGVLAFQQVAFQGQAIRGANGYILPWVALQCFLGRLTPGIEAAVRLFARHVKILAVAGDLPIHSQIGQSLAGPAAHRRSAHAHTGQRPQGDGRRRLFLHSGSAFLFFFHDTPRF